MATTTTNPKDRTLLAVIGDEDSVTGLLLAGIGDVDKNQKKNFLIVDASRPAYYSSISPEPEPPSHSSLMVSSSTYDHCSSSRSSSVLSCSLTFVLIDDRNISAETQTSVIESAFQDFTERKDVAILLINQHVAERIRPTVDRYQAAFPALLEIPSKEHPYDPAKDSVLKRVQKLRGD
ncbi:V-type ATPase, F subunit [Kwoniella heveanensis CBS 569]|nr:V-type ATPase, F subunit [Kwoniella heveanensis CBS 569]